MGVSSSLDAISFRNGRKASPDAEPKGKKSSKNKAKLCTCSLIIMINLCCHIYSTHSHTFEEKLIPQIALIFIIALILTAHASHG